ncbi:GntR family transcriptional regulator [Arthrobacter sp. MI7-26]|uniref:GntR family transcriptional regulator n=1 Tax=unclassified Arthrobacter TaxID=235627 RepID=UPI0022494205|nr:GntR family transcriptional regulator [Arthrobacter sp. MI7-26]MCX2746930.1 GntR family transcriptional regulator [Arthrobacter sp. MI7-26]UKA61222.1 GntR family transcriptional regulator [Arthrobacter sp. FW306-04-A]
MSGSIEFPGSWRPNQSSTVALYEQLRLRIIELADAGTLPVGTKLPAVRSLAGELDVAPHTVARAYKELEAAGVVATRGRNGTVVCARDDRWSALAAVAANYSAAAKAQGASFAEAVQLLAAAYDAD